MRLSTKGRYAVMAMTDLAGRQDADDLATWAAGRAIPLERAHEAAAAVA